MDWDKLERQINNSTSSFLEKHSIKSRPAFDSFVSSPAVSIRQEGLSRTDSYNDNTVSHLFAMVHAQQSRINSLYDLLGSNGKDKSYENDAIVKSLLSRIFVLEDAVSTLKEKNKIVQKDEFLEFQEYIGKSLSTVSNKIECNMNDISELHTCLEAGLLTARQSAISLQNSLRTFQTSVDGDIDVRSLIKRTHSSADNAEITSVSLPTRSALYNSQLETFQRINSIHEDMARLDRTLSSVVGSNSHLKDIAFEMQDKHEQYVQQTRLQLINLEAKIPVLVEASKVAMCDRTDKTLLEHSNQLSVISAKLNGMEVLLKQQREHLATVEEDVNALRQENFVSRSEFSALLKSVAAVESDVIANKREVARVVEMVKSLDTPKSNVDEIMLKSLEDRCKYMVIEEGKRCIDAATSISRDKDREISKIHEEIEAVRSSMKSKVLDKISELEYLNQSTAVKAEELSKDVTIGSNRVTNIMNEMSKVGLEVESMEVKLARLQSEVTAAKSLFVDNSMFSALKAQVESKLSAPAPTPIAASSVNTNTNELRDKLTALTARFNESRIESKDQQDDLVSLRSSLTNLRAALDSLQSEVCKGSEKSEDTAILEQLNVVLRDMESLKKTVDSHSTLIADTESDLTRLQDHGCRIARANSFRIKALADQLTIQNSSSVYPPPPNPPEVVPPPVIPNESVGAKFESLGAKMPSSVQLPSPISTVKPAEAAPSATKVSPKSKSPKDELPSSVKSGPISSLWVMEESSDESEEDFAIEEDSVVTVDGDALSNCDCDVVVNALTPDRARVKEMKAFFGYPGSPIGETPLNSEVDDRRPSGASVSVMNPESDDNPEVDEDTVPTPRSQASNDKEKYAFSNNFKRFVEPSNNPGVIQNQVSRPSSSITVKSSDIEDHEQSADLKSGKAAISSGSASSLLASWSSQKSSALPVNGHVKKSSLAPVHLPSRSTGSLPGLKIPGGARHSPASSPSKYPEDDDLFGHGERSRVHSGYSDAELSPEHHSAKPPIPRKNQQSSPENRETPPFLEQTHFPAGIKKDNQSRRFSVSSAGSNFAESTIEERPKNQENSESGSWNTDSDDSEHGIQPASKGSIANSSRFHGSSSDEIAARGGMNTASLVEEYKKSSSSNAQLKSFSTYDEYDSDFQSSDGEEENEVAKSHTNDSNEYKRNPTLEAIANAATKEAAMGTMRNFTDSRTDDAKRRNSNGSVNSDGSGGYVGIPAGNSAPSSASTPTNSTMQCPHCLKRILRTELKDHLQVCKLRMEVCKWGCGVKLLYSKMDTHKLTCPAYNQTYNG